MTSTATSRPVVEVVRLGLVSYHKALRLQQLYVDRHRSGPAHALLLCEHPPVYTTGIRHQPYPELMLERLRLLGADVHRSSRGGLITFHGPGQLVCYPILHLGSFKKVRWKDFLLRLYSLFFLLLLFIFLLLFLVLKWVVSNLISTLLSATMLLYYKTDISALKIS